MLVHQGIVWMRWWKVDKLCSWTIKNSLRRQLATKILLIKNSSAYSNLKVALIPDNQLHTLWHPFQIDLTNIYHTHCHAFIFAEVTKHNFCDSELTSLTDLKCFMNELEQFCLQSQWGDKKLRLHISCTCSHLSRTIQILMQPYGLVYTSLVVSIFTTDEFAGVTFQLYFGKPIKH